jgi:hypothetical protein
VVEEAKPAVEQEQILVLLKMIAEQAAAQEKAAADNITTSSSMNAMQERNELHAQLVLLANQLADIGQEGAT